MEKSYIWSMTNRVVHILLIVLFTLTYLINEDDLLKFHVIFAYLLGLVIVFRIVWGVIGPKYSKFSDFNFNINDLKEYLSKPFTNVKKHNGHNPASSWAVVAMLILGLIAMLSGMLAYGIEENKGVFSFLFSQSLKDMEIMEEIHEFSADLFLWVIIAHVAGSLIDKYIKNNDVIDSMITGYKTTVGERFTIKTNVFQKIFSILALFIFLFSIYYLSFVPDNMFIK